MDNSLVLRTFASCPLHIAPTFIHYILSTFAPPAIDRFLTFERFPLSIVLGPMEKGGEEVRGGGGEGEGRGRGGGEGSAY
jgi:hypothetical protein